LRFNDIKAKIQTMHKLLPLALVLLALMASCTRELAPTFILAPTADFAASQEEGIAPLAVSFTDLSTGSISRWHWDFGDGQFSNLSQPSYTYTTAGSYTVSLAIMGPGGSDIETKVEYIKVGSGIISWEEAGSYIGQYQVVEGVVVGAYYASETKSQLTFLDFHKPYQGYFKCIIWGRDREKFAKEFQTDPETYFLDKRVQVTGLIEEYPKGSGVPEIVLRDPSQIKVVVEQPTP
jgi:PKD repeat protein